ncbi:TolC family outer membrane protein [Variovorax sp. PvP013]|uniref:TolC family outer membrane protein n=1 Tax=Variovorax sp. PvP013 TaxID=3156435 RepID=UPI003D23BCF8
MIAPLRRLLAAGPPLLLAAAFTAPACGQSLVTLYEAARGYDATYQGALAQYDASIARAAQAKAGILPQVGVQAGVTRTDYDIEVLSGAPRGSATRAYTAQNAGINASQPLYRPAAWATYEQGLRQAEIARTVLTTAEQDLIVRVSQAYFDVLAAQDTLGLVRAQKAAVAEQLASAQRNFEVGTATITDSREAQSRYDLVLAQEIAAGNDLQVKRLALDTLVGQRGSAPLPLALPIVLPTPLPADMEAWVTRAQEAHPAIEQARLGVDVAALEVQKAEAGHKPTIDASLGYNVSRNPNGTVLTTVGTVARGPNVGVVLNMPLFAGFATQNRIRETLSLEDQSRATLEATRRGVAQATRTAYLGLISGAGQVRALEAAEASSQSALEANQLGYQVGVRINIDVLNSQSQLFQTRRDLALARYNVLLGHLRLRQANGTLSAPDLLPIDATLARDGGRPADPSVPAPATGSAVPAAAPPTSR